MKHALLGGCQHEVKVTRLKNGYGVRVFINGKLNQQDWAERRCDIGKVARAMLRMEDKCGNISAFAGAARNRGFRDPIKENNYKRI